MRSLITVVHEGVARTGSRPDSLSHRRQRKATARIIFALPLASRERFRSPCTGTLPMVPTGLKNT